VLVVISRLRSIARGVLILVLGLGSTVTFPVESGAKPRPLLILVHFEPRCDDTSYVQQRKFRKKCLVHSVAMGLFHEWA